MQKLTPKLTEYHMNYLTVNRHTVHVLVLLNRNIK